MIFRLGIIEQLGISYLTEKNQASYEYIFMLRKHENAFFGAMNVFFH